MVYAVLSPPPLAMKIVLVAIALVVLLAASGNLKVEFWAGSSAAPVAPEATHLDMRSATVRDVVAVTSAASVAADDLDEAQINGLLARYESDRDAAALAAIERAMPGFSRRVDRGIRRLSRRVASTHVTTAVGDRCRSMTSSFLNRQRLVFARFALQVKRNGATSAAVDRFIRSLRHVNGSYPHALHTCTARASREDREALKPLLAG
jgi:hypothetical protein